jgi:predicted Zn-dependent protease with MMP-like domain
MLSGVASEFGVDVMSTSGYDSTSIRHHIGTWAGRLPVPLVVLHVGDLDPDGVKIYQALMEDVTAWAEHENGVAEFVRLAVTSEQVASMAFPAILRIPTTSRRRRYHLR